MTTDTTCPSSGIQSHKYITTPCETRERTVKQESVTSAATCLCVVIRTYCEDSEDSSQSLTQQPVQLLFGESVHDEAEDKNGRKQKAQSSTQERVHTDASVVRRISPARAHRQSGLSLYCSHWGLTQCSLRALSCHLPFCTGLLQLIFSS